jgi:hypothetical protein
MPTLTAVAAAPRERHRRECTSIGRDQSVASAVRRSGSLTSRLLPTAGRIRRLESQVTAIVW